MSGSRLIACTTAGDAAGADTVAAAVAVAATTTDPGAEGALILDLRRSPRPPRGTLLASTAARRLEGAAATLDLRAAARGRVCFAVPGDAGSDAASVVARLGEPEIPAPLVMCVCDPVHFRAVLAAAPGGGRAALVRAAPGSERSLLALLVGELLDERIPVKAWTCPIGAIPGRRALAGLEPGGETGRRAARFAAALAPGRERSGRRPTGRLLGAEGGQALPAVLGVAALVVSLALILVAIGGAATAKGRLQRAADLAALSAARSMRDDFPRLFVPSRLPDGRVNPEHLERSQYMMRAEAAAQDGAEENGVDPDLASVRFPDGRSMGPLQVRVKIAAAVETDARGDADENATTEVSAEAEVTPPATPGGTTSQPAMASGGGYSGPLAYRQGKPMRPDVAAAFDRMAAAAAADGVSLIINSAFRSDAEQQALWNQHPDPRWVAPPGTSLHRCGTELDLGSPAAYGWLAANASRFGFTQRYSWEAWHYGFTAGPAPCSAAGERVGEDGALAKADGKGGSDQGLPAFVPGAYREPLLSSAARWNVSAALLAAQLFAESNFNPNAGSSAGAQGIAQFMPSTAAAYGLDDPYDPVASIDAQAHLMTDLLRQFGSPELALAAYNAGPGAVGSCNCIPPYPETQAYVAKIMAMLDGAGALAAPPPALEVRLVA
ncbi:MAG: transglycosylase SLT domain-containing protein [Solirubrobacterales bacterium]|nr:transglycosylase SLT domain-containing protein [Solirubrobacterales bacterium]